MGAETALRGPARKEETKILVNAFSSIAEKWKVTSDDQLALLGHPARSTYFKWKKNGGILPHDTQERVSYILGVHKALHILFLDDGIADGWIQKPNSNPLFGGKSALEFMVSGGVVNLYLVRNYLDAQRGGWS